MAHYYKLHCNGTSGSSYKVALYLNARGARLGAGRSRFSGRRDARCELAGRHNDMGEVPVLEVSGRRMSHPGAMLTWLAETTGKFAPTNHDDQGRALSAHRTHPSYARY